MRWLDSTRGLRFADYAALWRWSTTDVPGFWSAVWDYYGLDARSSHSTRSTHSSSSSSSDDVLADASMPGASWFPGARLNFAERCLARASEERPALIGLDEGGVPVETTWAQLGREVAALAASLRRLGVGPATGSPATFRTPRTP